MPIANRSERNQLPKELRRQIQSVIRTALNQQEDLVQYLTPQTETPNETEIWWGPDNALEYRDDYVRIYNNVLDKLLQALLLSEELYNL
jgi:hypothetical protein